MKNFEAIFNCMLIAIILYQAVYFLVQFTVMKRIELFYYSANLICLGFYYYAYVLAVILHLQPGLQKVFFAVKAPLQFFAHMLYILFIIHYLDSRSRSSLFYRFATYYKYFCLFFSFFFLVPGAMNVETNTLFHIVTFVLLLFSVVIVFMLARIHTLYARVILYGTLCSLAGVCGTHFFVMSGANIDNPASYAYIPMQVGELFDVFILGYGLSMKAADRDKKLVQILLENQQILESERSRTAKDLHDGLGGMLSGIKLNLSSMKGNMIVHENDAALFNKSIGQLDSAIAEMRRVAHNMMPEALLKFGIIEAVQDYCDGINDSKMIATKFTHLGFDHRLDKSTEVILYRIIQELSNNAIKHAAATNIFIQITQHERGLTLTVEDDGKGFDVAQITKGAGLQNVQSRVDYLNGNMEISSTPGVGSTFNLEIPL